MISFQIGIIYRGYDSQENGTLWGQVSMWVNIFVQDAKIGSVIWRNRYTPIYVIIINTSIITCFPRKKYLKCFVMSGCHQRSIVITLWHYAIKASKIPVICFYISVRNLLRKYYFIIFFFFNYNNFKRLNSIYIFSTYFSLEIHAIPRIHRIRIVTAEKPADSLAI